MRDCVDAHTYLNSTTPVSASAAASEKPPTRNARTEAVLSTLIRATIVVPANDVCAARTACHDEAGHRATAREPPVQGRR